MDFVGLIRNLNTYEIERKVREYEALPKKKNIAFKSTPTLSDVNEDLRQEEDDEKLSLLVKNVRRMFYKREKFNNY